MTKNPINVLSLFDGMSCGQIALNRAKIKYNNYYASEIDKYAITVTQANYPDTIQLGDVSKLRTRTLPKIDLLIGGSPCFAGTTKIICKNKLKDIKNIKIGDKVLTHKNKYQKVINIGHSDSVIYKLVSQSGTTTKTTGDHPYYVRERIKKWNNQKRTYEFLFNKPAWKPVKRICKNDYVGTPILRTNSNPDSLTLEEAQKDGIIDDYERETLDRLKEKLLANAEQIAEADGIISEDEVRLLIKIGKALK